MNPNTHYTTIVIGGGPSGLMAATAAATQGGRVLLIEKGGKLGRKLAISGGGRCNVTNNVPISELIQNIPGNGRFMYSPFAVFNNQDIIRFFESLGIRLKEEDRGRMFPYNDKALTVVNALVQQVKSLGVAIQLHTPVETVCYQDGRTVGVLLRSGEFITGETVIIAVGGMSVPQTGSTGDGYAWARKAGHAITDLYPTEVPITSDEPFIQAKTLQGLALRSIHLAVFNPKGKKLIEHEGDLLFTHFGLSGPAALRCSQFVVKALKKSTASQLLMTIDIFPAQTAESVKERLITEAAQQPKRALKNLLKGLMPERFVSVLLEKAQVSGEDASNQVSKATWSQLSALLKGFPVFVNGTLSLKEAFVTGGGVHLKEIEPQTMQSKKMAGLYFCGEILDIHGYTGGYNITVAFSTGYAAGKSAAESTRKVL